MTVQDELFTLVSNTMVGKDRPRKIALVDQNLNAVWMASARRYARQGTLNANDVVNIMNEFLANGESEGVVADMVLTSGTQQAADPTQDIPHQNLFPGVNTVESWVRFVQEKKKSLRADQVTQLNELGAYLQKFNIRETAEEKEAAKQKREPTPEDKLYAEARRLVNTIGPDDIAETTSRLGDSAWTRVAKARNYLTNYINECAKRGISGERVLASVRQHFNGMSNSSIR
jgi:hypothetical protein